MKTQIVYIALVSNLTSGCVNIINAFSNKKSAQEYADKINAMSEERDIWCTIHAREVNDN